MRDMARKILWSGSTALPAPVEITVGDEIIWSSNTGRVASGAMVGDVIAEKKNINIKWGVLTEKELAVIKNVMKAGFFRLSFRDDGIDMEITSYRSALNKEAIGYLSDGIYYYKSASVQIIER